MENELQKLKSEALEQLEGLAKETELEDFRVKYLGRKGLFSGLMKKLGQVDVADRPRVGKLANEVKQEVEAKAANSVLLLLVTN